MRESESSDILESPETTSMQGMITQNHQVDVNQATWAKLLPSSSVRLRLVFNRDFSVLLHHGIN